METTSFRSLSCNITSRDEQAFFQEIISSRRGIFDLDHRDARRPRWDGPRGGSTQGRRRAADGDPPPASSAEALPFRPTLDVPNAETLAAMREADRIASDPDAKGFASVDELFADLDA